jgi:hypothetical protein
LVKGEEEMNHDALIAILILATIPPLLVLMWCSRASLQGIDWERRLKIREALIIARLPHAVHLWRSLLLAVQEQKSEDEIKKCTKDVREYLELMAK